MYEARLQAYPPLSTIPILRRKALEENKTSEYKSPGGGSVAWSIGPGSWAQRIFVKDGAFRAWGDPMPPAKLQTHSPSP